MPQSVPQRPANSSIADRITGNAVAARHGMRSVDELSFLLGGCLPTVTSQRFKVPSGSSAFIQIPYTRSRGANAIAIGIELHEGTAAGSRCTVTTTVSSGSITWISSGGLDGSMTLGPDYGTLHNYQQIIGVADVTGLTIGTTVYLKFAWADVSNSRGIHSITIVEVPLGYTDPTSAPTTEISAELAWPQSGVSNLLIDGTASTARGFVRLFDQTDKARTDVRRQRSLCTYEDTTNAWAVTDTSASPTVAVPMGMGSTPIFQDHARYIWGSSIANTCTGAIRYTTSTTNTGTFRCVVTPVGGSPANTDVSLVTSGGGVWTTKTFTLSLPTSGTLNEYTIEFHCRTSSGTLWISTIGDVEAET